MNVHTPIISTLQTVLDAWSKSLAAGTREDYITIESVSGIITRTHIRNGISTSRGARHIPNEELYEHFEKFKSIMLANGFATGVTEVSTTGVSRTIGVYFKHKQLSQDPDEFCIAVIDFQEKEIFFGEVGKFPKYIDQYSQLIDRQL